MHKRNRGFRGSVIACAFAVTFSSLLAVHTADAAGTSKSITTCTNIRTKVMRLLLKGVCNKKTEKIQFWILKPAPGPNTSTPSSEKPNTAKFNEYFSDFYLGKMDIGKVIGTDGFPTRSTSFTKGVDLLCTMMSIKKTIAAGHLGEAIYDVVAKTYVQAKSVFPKELTAGGSGGCSSLNQSPGKYEKRLYIDDVLVAVFTFEVK